MRISMSYKITRNRLPSISKEAHAAIASATERTAKTMAARAKTLAPVDSRALRNSIYYSTWTSSSYARSIAAAQNSYDAAELSGSTPKGRTPTPPEFDDEEKPSSPLEAYIACPIQYGPHVEYGTVITPAHPFIAPARREVRPEYTRECSNVLRRVGSRV